MNLGTRLKRTAAAAVAAMALTSALAACNVDTSSNAATGHHHKGKSTSKSKSDAPKYTTAQEQAITSAKNYLAIGSGFSRAGLIGQLSSKAGDGFKLADATFAVDHVEVDWNKQAVESAKNYMQLGSGFSRSGLIEQLTSKAGDQFTMAQATYAANHVGL